MRSLDHVSPTTVSAGLLRWLSGKEHTCQCRRHRKHEFASRVGGFPEKEMVSHSSKESHGQRSLEGSMGSQRVRHNLATAHLKE